MPTGVALRDARQQLLDAAERVLLRDGPGALTSRTVTAEAGCAKGVLHRHFKDFDDLLVELVRDHAGRTMARGEALKAAVGTGTVQDNVAEALEELFTSVAVAVVPLMTFRDELRARLRQTWPTSLPVLQEAADSIAAYLAAERGLGRIAPGADTDTLARMLIGTGHLLYADRRVAPPAAETVRATISAALPMRG
ncbi:TetR/AcrR family transcriptional regulator [Dactylosporangium sp. NPDC006015]|uniref:TetR/AcrR family transcriptional regulator n=1 Tax=Dactylosporangium sp. NPDC006015 TaxID=3154576 RepID=UPI0033AC8554